MSSDKAALDVEARVIAAERLTFFSDAVVAIAITLLALELPVPDANTNAELMHAAAENRAEYLAFLISFFAIGAYWRAHHRLFRYVSSLGGAVIRLSFGWMLMLILMPFATKVLQGDGAFETRFVFYACVQVVALLMFLLMIREVKRLHLYREDAPMQLFRDSYRGIAAMGLGFLVSIPLAFVVGSWAYACWAVVPLAETLWGRFARH